MSTSRVFKTWTRAINFFGASGFRELAAGRTEAATAAVGRGKRCCGDQFRSDHRRNHHLRDTLATADRERRVAVVDQQHADLAAIVRINRAWRIQHGDTVLRCDARAWTDLRLIT